MATEKVRAHIRKTPSGKLTGVKSYQRKGEEHEQLRGKELQMWWKWKLGGERPQDLKPLVRSFMPLVNKQASVYVGKVQMPPEAIRAEYIKQLVTGLKAYDPTKGAALTTALVWYMKKAQRFIMTYQNTARIPEEDIRFIRVFESARAELGEEHDRAPTDEELAKRLGWSVAKVVKMDTQLRKDLSTSKFESDPTSVMPAAEKELLKLFLYELKEEEQEAYRYLTGLGRERITDVQKLAAKLDIPQHKVYRIRMGIAKKLKAYVDSVGTEGTYVSQRQSFTAPTTSKRAR
jgi:DNA-directed RNA polymerase sigma subunit (sigma70/sigma32)